MTNYINFFTEVFVVLLLFFSVLLHAEENSWQEEFLDQEETIHSVYNPNEEWLMLEDNETVLKESDLFWSDLSPKETNEDGEYYDEEYYYNSNDNDDYNN